MSVETVSNTPNSQANELVATSVKENSKVRTGKVSQEILPQAKVVETNSIDTKQAKRFVRKKTITATSVATVAVAAGTTSAVSGLGAFALQHVIGFSVYLAYSPSNAFSQYAVAQMAASMSNAIVSSTFISVIANVALGILVTLSVIFFAVIIYNLFLSKSSEDELSFFQVIGRTFSTVFGRFFAG